jgi:5-methylcytosine-specific restriction protein A
VATAFLTGPLQSLCIACHNRDKQHIERKGFAPGIGPDGWPLDPRHPAYKQA